jgi:hypothetical protein
MIWLIEKSIRDKEILSLCETMNREGGKDGLQIRSGE